jgi:hypothetical protein
MNLEKSWEVISIAFACARRGSSWLILLFRLVFSTRAKDIFQAVFRSLRNNSTWPSTCLSVKLLAQLAHSQKFSIALAFCVWKPKNLPPSMRISILEHCGLAHFEIMSQWRLLIR